MTRRLLRPLVFASTSALVLAITIFVTTGVAHACLCTSGLSTLANRVGAADLAFTGQVTSVVPTSNPINTVSVTFAVDTVVKGSATTPTSVEAFGMYNTCAVSVNVGDVLGVITDRRRDGSYGVVSICDPFVSPSQLTAPGLLDPPPTDASAGHPQVAVAARYGPDTVLGFDADARFAKAGAGGKTPADVAGCPGGQRVVTVDQREVITYDATTFAILNRFTLPPAATGDDQYGATSLRCLDASASDVAWARSNYQTTNVIMDRVSGGAFSETNLGGHAWDRVVLNPAATLAAVADADGVRLVATADGSSIGTIPITSTLEGNPYPAFDATGTRLALLTIPPNPNPGLPTEYFLRVATLDGTTLVGVSPPVTVAGRSPGPPTWTSDGTVLVNILDSQDLTVSRVVEITTKGTTVWSARVDKPTSSLLKVGSDVYALVGTDGAKLVVLHANGTSTALVPDADPTALALIPAAPVVAPTPPPATPVTVTPTFTG